jgi:hypothetical protein
MKFEDYIKEFLKIAETMPPGERNTFKALCERRDAVEMVHMLNRWYGRGDVRSEFFRRLMEDFFMTFVY